MKFRALYFSTILSFTLALLSVNPGFAANKVSLVPVGSKVFIAPMVGNLNGFISPEIIKQKLPLIIVMDEADADFVLAGASIQGDNKWFNSIWGGKDKNEANVQLFCIKDKRLVWAGEAGDRSLFGTAYRRGGLRKVADRIVKQMKKDVFYR
jgi:hypothetical protein